MSVEVKVPQLSESVSEATLLKWHKKEGDHVDRDENLIDIETDKVVLEVPSPADGFLAKIMKGDGATVTSGEVIASIDTGTAKDMAAAKEAVTQAAEPAPTPSASESRQEDRKPVKWPEPQPTRKPSARGSTPAMPMMPAARSVAEAAGLGEAEISSISGSGRGGRITKEDVTSHVERKEHEDQKVQPAPPCG